MCVVSASMSMSVSVSMSMSVSMSVSMPVPVSASMSMSVSACACRRCALQRMQSSWRRCMCLFMDVYICSYIHTGICIHTYIRH